ncbi:MAG: DUF2130 domain-containing protein [Erysipelotrichaceae bacterium]|jgi:hypothetical protein|nr:DUF2130 domain-containing protein [Erysipelotrichaceae bacterium]
MAILKVLIKDKNTLELQEAGNKGDLIDLSSLDAANVSNVDSAIKQAARNEALKEVTKEKDLELRVKLSDSENKLKEEYESKIKKLETLNLNNEYEIKQLKSLEHDKEIALTNKVKQEFDSKLNEKEKEILTLKNNLQMEELKKKAEIENTKRDLENKNKDLMVSLDKKDDEFKLKLNEINKEHQLKLKEKEEEVTFYKDLKAKQSTKLVGETLEKHCEIEFEQKIRPFVIGQSVAFKKDNDVIDGTKGDYIYREFDSDGNEMLSIMFEMKNESDTSTNKKKNDDFLEKLDKDRTKKSCEYAILVSLLEPDNELYNQGIVDKSFLYDKMYVIRPQYFIPVISFLRNSARKSLEYRKKLTIAQSQSQDVTNFENDLNAFKEGFGRNYRLASEKFQRAIKKLEEQRDDIQKIIDNLTGSENNLRLANNKLEDLTIRKLTKNNPTMKDAFAKVAEDKEK